MSKSNYKALLRRERVNRLTRGGNGRKALLEYRSIPARFRQKIEQILSWDPGKWAQNGTSPEQSHRYHEKLTPPPKLQRFIRPDQEADVYFSEYRKEDGSLLSQARQESYVWTAIVLDAADRCYRESLAYRKRRGKSSRGAWDEVLAMIYRLDVKDYPHCISGCAKTVRRKVLSLRYEGYASIIPGTLGNDNRLKIKGAVADWILAQYSLPHKLTIPELLKIYNARRDEKSWPLLSERGIHVFLSKPENKRKWVLARHGKQAWQNAYGHHLKRGRQNWFPNAYWAIDGSKLDWIHFKESSSNKMGAELRVNLNFDMYSEKILGYNLSETESHVDHFHTIKMSVDEAGASPYLLTYDKQAGHMSAKMQTLYSNLVATGGTHYSHRAGRKSSPVEQVLSRVQQQVFNKFYFSDKQSITSKKQDSKPNMDFIREHRHRLWCKGDLHQALEVAIENWNAMEHPGFPGESRNDVYQHAAPMGLSITDQQAAEIFWIEGTRGSRYSKGGISIVVDHQKYEYEVYEESGQVDIAFRRFHIGRKFIVKYDPSAMNIVGLYEKAKDGSLRYVASARAKREHEVVPILMKDGDRAAINEDMAVRQHEMEETEQELDRIREESGVSPEKLIEDQELMIKQRGMLHKEEAIKTEKSVFERL